MLAEERGPVIVVADDDDALRQTIAQILALDGHTVLQAHDGNQVLALLHNQSVSVLVLDLAMPRCDGISVLRELHSPPPTVIVHSAFEYYSMEQLDHLDLGTLIFRVLRKPVPPRELLEAVSDALAG